MLVDAFLKEYYSGVKAWEENARCGTAEHRLPRFPLPAASRSSKRSARRSGLVSIIDDHSSQARQDVARTVYAQNPRSAGFEDPRKGYVHCGVVVSKTGYLERGFFSVLLT